ncbi:ribonuclease P protein component [Patescibacteria group bacterium]|nr:ribonuclease P protein component [Patescibacteria group bacterium]
MLAKKFRLPKETRFDNFSFSQPFFFLKIAKNKEKNSRFGVIVSKKVDKRAVVRNRLRRAFINCIDSQIIEIKTGYDTLFIVRKKSLEKESMELCASIRGSFLKNNLLK